MEYMSAIEASEKWGISLRQVQRLLADNRIPRAKKYRRLWVIPADAAKPTDLRKEKKQPNNPLSAELSYIIAATTIPMPQNNPDAILDDIDDARLRLQYEGELAYLRGDFKRAMRCFHETGRDDAAKLRSCPVAIAAAISMGDYNFYTEVDTYLQGCAKANKGSDISAFAELAHATAAVSAIAPNMAPDWLKKGDFSALPAQAKPNAFYLRAKYFQCLGRYEAMLAVAQTALSFCAVKQGVTMTDIYLRLMCAVACYSLERTDEAELYLLDAMNVSLPHGFITPFAETVTAFGGLMELCLENAFPDYYNAVISQWKRTWKNWISFHNQFTKDNITLILSLREYHIALLVARHVPYSKIAKQYCISVGRLKNIMLEIYSKLSISGRDELSKYIF